jgi:hypothetical protein
LSQLFLETALWQLRVVLHLFNNIEELRIVLSFLYRVIAWWLLIPSVIRGLIIINHLFVNKGLNIVQKCYNSLESTLFGLQPGHFSLQALLFLRLNFNSQIFKFLLEVA